MCESTAYLLKNGEEEKILEDVVMVKPDGNRILLTSLLGQELVVEGEFVHFDLLNHRLVIRPKS